MAEAGYIYLIQEREFINSGEQVYKMGRTSQETLGRFGQYPKGSQLLFHIRTNNVISSETQILKIFRSSFKERKDIGAEYFEGNPDEMIKIIYGHVGPVSSDLSNSPVNDGAVPKPIFSYTYEDFQKDVDSRVIKESELVSLLSRFVVIHDGSIYMRRDVGRNTILPKTKVSIVNKGDFRLLFCKDIRVLIEKMTWPKGNIVSEVNKILPKIINYRPFANNPVLYFFKTIVCSDDEDKFKVFSSLVRSGRAALLKTNILHVFCHHSGLFETIPDVVFGFAQDQYRQKRASEGLIIPSVIADTYREIMSCPVLQDQRRTEEILAELEKYKEPYNKAVHDKTIPKLAGEVITGAVKPIIIKETIEDVEEPKKISLPTFSEVLNGPTGPRKSCPENISQDVKRISQQFEIIKKNDPLYLSIAQNVRNEMNGMNGMNGYHPLMEQSIQSIYPEHNQNVQPVIQPIQSIYPEHDQNVQTVQTNYPSQNVQSIYPTQIQDQMIQTQSRPVQSIQSAQTPRYILNVQPEQSMQTEYVQYVPPTKYVQPNVQRRPDTSKRRNTLMSVLYSFFGENK